MELYPILCLALIFYSVACWADKVDEHFTDVIQSTGLRAPEVSIGAGWGKPADIWSLGCTVRDLPDNNQHYQVLDFPFADLRACHGQPSISARFL